MRLSGATGAVIRLAPTDPHNPEDDGPRCSACVRAYGPAGPTGAQLELEFETVSEQTQFALARCKEPGCAQPVVGSSITGVGHVCARHNEIEWGRALAANRDGYYRNLGRRLLRQGQRRLTARHTAETPSRSRC